MSQTDQTATIENVLNYHIFLSLKTFYWSIVDLYHYVYFYWTAKWSSYIYIYICYIHVLFWELHSFLSGKEFTCQCRRHRRLEVDPWVRKISLTQGGGKDQGGGDGNPLMNSCWDNPMDRGAWWATVYRITKSLTWQSKHMHIPSHFDLSSQLWLNYKLCNYKVYWVYRKLWGQLTASTNRVIHTITESLDSWVQFSSVTQSCLTLCNPMDCRTPGLPVHGQLPEFTQTNVHWVGDAIQPSHLLLSSSPHAFNVSQHQVFLNESVLQSRWPKYWSFSFSISPSNEYSELISFRMDWLDLLAVQGTLKSLLQHHREDSWVKNY